MAVAGAAAYGLRWPLDGKTASLALKMTPALAMAAEVVRQRGRQAPALTIALLLGALGDCLLDLGADRLLAGMAAFFAGHLAYVTAFMPHSRPWSALSAQRRAAIAALLVAVTALSVYVWSLAPSSPRMPSVVYAVALCAMAVVALKGDWNNRLVPAGALLFVLSDALLAWRMFANEQTLSGLVWPTYVAAQILMPLGYLNATRAHAA